MVDLVKIASSALGVTHVILLAENVVCDLYLIYEMHLITNDNWYLTGTSFFSQIKHSIISLIVFTPIAKQQNVNEEKNFFLYAVIAVLCISLTMNGFMLTWEVKRVTVNTVYKVRGSAQKKMTKFYRFIKKKIAEFSLFFQQIYFNNSKKKIILIIYIQI